MAKQTEQISPSTYIQPLNMNGLQGRMLRMPGKKSGGREILLVYGHHSSIERWFGLIQALSKYGTVTVPDLPGFGGMDSFYTIGQKPTLDAMADYLAAFIKLRYKRRRITIVGMSFGFTVITRMLQRFPEMAKKIDLLISVIGFAHKDDFSIKPHIYWGYRLACKLLVARPVAYFFRTVCLQPAVLRFVYTKMDNAKFRGLTPEQDEQMLQVEIGLWRSNDVRTWARTATEMLTIDNCRHQIVLPVWHVGVANDHFFNNYNVEQHLKVIFSDFHGFTIKLGKHAPTVIATPKEAEQYLPLALRRALGKIS